MAEKRMFAKSIVDSDAFLDMPLSSQALYFHLGMRADDDGFINSAKKIQRMIGSADDDLRILIAKNFVIPFEDGVCVIKHWKIHNLIQKDRYKPTLYTDHFNKISLKNNKVYSMETQCIQDVSIVETICTPRLGKVRLGKDSVDKSNTPDGVSPALWKDFLKVRKEKRLAVTDAAIKKIQKEAEKAGLTFEQAITVCCERGWAGFNASWDRGESLPANNLPTYRKTEFGYEKWQESLGRYAKIAFEQIPEGERAGL